MGKTKSIAGRLRERITIQQPTKTRDASGTPIDTWSDFAAELPAESISVGGGETLRGRQVHAEASRVFVTRYREGITVRMRVVWHGLVWGIVSVGDPYGDRVQIRIDCKGAA